VFCKNNARTNQLLPIKPYPAQFYFLCPRWCKCKKVVSHGLKRFVFLPTLVRYVRCPFIHDEGFSTNRITVLVFAGLWFLLRIWMCLMLDVVDWEFWRNGKAVIFSVLNFFNFLIFGLCYPLKIKTSFYQLSHFHHNSMLFALDGVNAGSLGIMG
jgi:hypothetical protein